MKLFGWIVGLASTAIALVLVLVGALMGSSLILISGMLSPLVILGALGLHYARVGRKADELERMRSKDSEKSLTGFAQTIQDARAAVKDAKLGTDFQTKLENDLSAALLPRVRLEFRADHVHLTRLAPETDRAWIAKTKAATRETLGNLAIDAAPILEDRLAALATLGVADAKVPTDSLVHTCREYSHRVASARKDLDARIVELSSAVDRFMKRGKVVAHLQTELETVENLFDEADFVGSQTTLAALREALNKEWAPEIDTRRAEMVRAIASWRTVTLPQKVAGSNVGLLADIESRAGSAPLDDKGGSHVLDVAEADFCAMLTQTHRAVLAWGDEVLEELRRAEVQEDAVTISAALDRLRGQPELEPPLTGWFEMWVASVTQAADAISIQEKDSRFRRAMIKLAPAIRKHLDEKGRVTIQDLNLRDGGARILHLYARSHPADVRETLGPDGELAQLEAAHGR